jgi:hypothetical protein
MGWMSLSLTINNGYEWAYLSDDAPFVFFFYLIFFQENPPSTARKANC